MLDDEVEHEHHESQEGLRPTGLGRHFFYRRGAVDRLLGAAATVVGTSPPGPL